MRISYRFQQIWLALTASPVTVDFTAARGILSPSLFSLFSRMQPSEQIHSLRIVHKLQEDKQVPHDLLVAALLHDVGKSLHPLRPWERVVIVLGRALLPFKTKQWGQGDARGWKKPFAVGYQHAAWGAQMVTKAGGSNLTASIIRRHHDPVKPVTQEMIAAGTAELEDYLLFRMQSLDN